MKSNLFGFLLLLGLAVFVPPAVARYSGFESNINRMITAYKILIEDVERGFSRLTFYFDNFDDYSTNDEYYTVTFTDSLNYTLESLEESKAAIYDSLQVLVSEIFAVDSHRSTYHKKLQDGYDEVVQFIATLDDDDLDQTLRDLFNEFVTKKNLFFYNVANLKSSTEFTTINLINVFDMLETFMHDTMSTSNGKFSKLTVEQVKTFRFIPGLLTQLKEYYQIHNELEEEINRSFVSIEETVNDLDGYLESLKFYYYRRYVEGYTEEQINNFPQVLFSEDVEKNPDEPEGEEEAQRDPLDVCDQVLLSNFGIEGYTSAQIVDEFEKIPHCPAIESTCCRTQEIAIHYRGYYGYKFDVLNRKQKLVRGILSKILNSYQTLTDLAYHFLKSPSSSETCRDVGRKVVFTPISRDFVDKLSLHMTNAFEFASRSRASVLCMVCDYDFHKSMNENKEIRLSREFCSSMMDNLYAYLSIYHLQLVDYFNNVVDLVQCNKETGVLEKDVLLNFQTDPEVGQVIADCAGNRDFCEPFCRRFEFLNLDSDLETDIPTLRRFYNFLDYRLKEMEKPMFGNINSDYFTAAGIEYQLEYNDLPSKSIDNMKRVFVQDVSDKTAQNPFTIGTELLQVLREEGGPEE